MPQSLLIAVICTAYFGFTHAQSIYYGTHFVCDASDTDTTCEKGDNIVCNAHSDCTVQCDDDCNGLIINAKLAKSLAITNCVDCDHMIIYCPTAFYKGASILNSICTLELSNDVRNLNVYAQEAFNDFRIIQSYSETSVDHYVLSSSMHCGDLFMIEYQCELDMDGNSCDTHTAQCQNYRIPTISPTTPPTSHTTASPTKAPSDGIPSTSVQTKPFTTESADDMDVINAKESDERVTVVTETHNHNAHYVMLIIGLCIIWGSFFCCFIIMYYHREKKHQLTKAVSIISRPKSPSYHPSKSKTKSKSEVKYTHAKSIALSPNAKPSKRPDLSQTSTANKAKIFLPVPEPSMMSASKTLYKEKSVSGSMNTMITVDIAGDEEDRHHRNPHHHHIHHPKPPLKALQDRRKIQSEAFTVEVIPSFSPGATPRYALSPRMGDFRSPRLSPRPYFYDGHHNITPAASCIQVVSPRRPRLVLGGGDDVYSNPMSNTTAEAVEIKLPCYDEHKQEMESECVLATPQFGQFDEAEEDHAEATHDIKEDEGSVDSKYASRSYQEIMKGHMNDNMEEKEEVEMEDDQTEGDDKSVRDHNNNKGLQMYDAYPPPPPPSLETDVNNVNTVNHNSTVAYGISSDIHHNAIESPSRHYRVKYSLGIQQDIKNCMSVPGFVGEKKFVFDEHKVNRTQSVSPNGLLKPPTILSPSSSYHSYRKYYAAPNPPVANVEDRNDNNYYYEENPVTPQPVPQSNYLSFPQNRPRIYSDPTFPANNLCN